MDACRQMLLTLGMLYILLLPVGATAQDKSLEWINKNALKLQTDSTDQDLRFLSKILKDKKLVGLGEASHGTHEFYFQKSRIIKYLVRQDKYRLIAIESSSTYIEPINTYVQTGKGDLKSMLQPLGLYNTEELYKLCQWLKVFNASQTLNNQVKIIGFDDEGYWSDPFTRDENMAKKFIEAHKKDDLKSILWAHNLHLAKDTTMAQFKAMGFHLKKHYGDNYYVIGFDTYSGTVSTLNNGQFETHGFTGKENTLSDLFNKANLTTFFIDFHDASNPFLHSKKSITNIYSNWQGEPTPLPIVPGADFDGLIFIRKTTASEESN